MDIFTKSILYSIIIAQGIFLHCGEEHTKQWTLNQNTKTGLLISAIPAAVYMWTRLKHNVEYWVGAQNWDGSNPSDASLYAKRPFLKLLKPTRIEIDTKDIFLHNSDYPVAKQWWVKEYVIAATDTNVNRLEKVDFEHKLGKSLMRTTLICAGVFTAKGLYDSFKEYRNDNFIKDEKKI